MRVFSAMVMGCALALGGWPQAASADPFKLNSGKIVDIVAVNVETTAAGRTLNLQYRSDTPLADAATLRKEADGLWEHFLVNAERGRHKRAVIRALGPKTGNAKKPVDFIFVKRSGDWRTLENGLVRGGRISEAFIREFVERLRVPLLNDSRNAALLYMARDWRGTLADPKFGAYAPKTFDRTTFLENLSIGMARVSNYVSEYEILATEIDDGGRTARVESRDSGRMTVDGYRVTIHTRSVDHFELRDGTMIWTKSNGRVEDRQVTR